MRLALLSTISWLVTLTAPLFSALGRDISWRDLILIAGGLFLLWKATAEIHHTVVPVKSHGQPDKNAQVAKNFGAVIIQILLIDIVFSVDSILTAIGMTEHLPIMVIAVVTAVAVMLVAADPLANFINKNPTVVMLALGFLIMIGVVLIADGLGHKVPKGYIYTAMAFSALVEGLNMMVRNADAKKQALKDQGQ
jgi:predicted tellurium resistance membrane protein TerC